MNAAQLSQRWEDMAEQEREEERHAPPTYPYKTEDGRTVWACCVSRVGRPCQHLRGVR